MAITCIASIGILIFALWATVDAERNGDDDLAMLIIIAAIGVIAVSLKALLETGG